MHSKLVKELGFKEAEDLYLSEGIKEFNAIVTQSFNKLYLTDESVFIGAPTGSNILQCAELAIFREIQQEHFEKIAYICPVESICKLRTKYWKQRLGDKVGLSVEMLTGNLQQDLQILAKTDIIIATAERWDLISRKWRQRKAVK